MTEPTIFPTDQVGSQEGDNTPSTSPDTTVPAIPVELADYVGPGKKYATLTEAHKAFPNAQNHITSLTSDITRAKEENEALKAELAKRKTAEELLADIKQTTPTSSTPAPVDANPAILSEVVKNELARQAQESAATERANLEKENQTRVVQAFKNQYGDKAEEFYSKLATESSMSISALNSLTATSPEAVMKLAGLTFKPKGNVGSLESTVNSQAVLSNINPSTDSGIRLKGNHSSKDLAKAWAKSREAVNKKLGIN